MRVTLLRDIGAATTPFNAFQFIQGVETAPLRMRRYCENADAIAGFLAKHPKVTRVIYPGLMAGEARRARTPISRAGSARCSALN